MLLFSKRPLHTRKRRHREDTTMNLDNRRLFEIRREKIAYQRLLDESDKISDCLIYQGKLESLNREEKQILERYDVIT